jgi:L-fuculose-phosphate aldolase
MPDAARRIARCCRRLADIGLIAGADGNVSVRIAADRVLVTPSGLIKGQLEPEDMVEVDLAGAVLKGRHRPSAELDLHLRILRARTSVQAVIHAHPPVATGLSVAGREFDWDVLPEMVFLVGKVPVVPYGAPGTPELGDRIEPFIQDHDALILANHGAVSLGASLDEAQIRMETLEHSAKIVVTARLLGHVTPLAPDEVHRLETLRRSRDRREEPPSRPAPDPDGPAKES